MNRELIEALDLVEKEKGISKATLIDAIESALASAYKKDQKNHQNIKVHLNQETGDFRVYSYKQVVNEEDLEDDRLEMTLQEARAINPSYEVGDQVEMEIFPKEFGRIAAQTAKQVVVQRMREAERSIVYDEFSNRVGDIVTGVVQRFEQRNVFVELGRIEAILPPNEQIPGERYEHGMRVKTFLVEVKKTSKGPQVILSRTRNGLLKRLFELEVPEIQDGTVEIKAVSREPGARSKIAVYSRNENVDPVGACVGAKGNRVQMIVRELKGEKIDVIPWNSDPVFFIIKAMSPSKVSDVKLFPSKKMALVIVPDYQLSLAIGKEGQNARLAAKLTGWKIDIKSETQAQEAWENIEAMVAEEEALREDYVGEEPETAEAEEEWYEEEEMTAEADQPEETPEEEANADEYYEEDDYEESEEDYTEPEVNESEEEEEPETEAKKKVKKAAKTKRRERSQEFVDEVEEGISFFTDVIKDNSEAAEKAEKENEVVFSSEGSGFTLGQLLSNELKKKSSMEKPAPKGKSPKKEKSSPKTKTEAKKPSSRSGGKKKEVDPKDDEG
jgi:N utilization substance protein A